MRSLQAGALHADSKAVALALLPALVVLGCDKSAGGPAVPSADHELVGAKAPEFELPARSGGATLAPQAHAGKVVIVDFWATWCAPCKESFPFYQALTQKYDGQVVVLAVSVDEEAGGIGDFVSETKVSFPVGWDEGQAVARLYGPETMPTSYLIDRHGVVQFVHAGFKSGDTESIRHELEQLLNSP